MISSANNQPTSALEKAKRDLRASMRRARSSIPPREQSRAADGAAAHLAELARRQGARIVSLYAATSAELGTEAAAARLAAAGIALAYPRVAIRERRLTFHRVEAPSALEPGALGIFEPASSAPRIPIDQIDLFVVPGLAFDTRGARLGWGQGYYDRVLVQHPNATRVGFAFDAQIVSYAPSTDRDVPMDHIVSEEGVLRCRHYEEIPAQAT